ncbi:ubiquinol-cytochrome c reductase iron-sulfur subunit [Lacipirellula sp.]|uniref:QcrA and Rieske domain-containing protein n=1 Tax=Lacipirellula sp. TaxID=2691419 RepID=UPI003D096286
MADKKKLTVAEMLAAARAVDGGAAKPADAPPSSEVPPAAATPSPAESAAAPAAPIKPAVGPGGARPSVADMLAAARANKGGAAPAPAEPAAAAPKPKPAAAVAKPAEPTAPAEPRDTASILGAARKGEKAGPISKAEAAAKAPAPAPPKPTIVVPPMPLKPDYAKPKVAVAAKAIDDEADRRDFVGIMLAVGFWMTGIIGTLWTLLTVKFMFPNVLREPPSKFKVGFPDAFPGGQVQEKFKAQFGIWVVNAEYNGQQQIVALKSVCTHLGCTPNWLEAEQKFKCPCHGSGFYKDGINFEGPAPRPLERYAIRLADDGQIEVDKSRTFQEEMGAWTDPGSFIPV